MRNAGPDPLAYTSDVPDLETGFALAAGPGLLRERPERTSRTVIETRPGEEGVVASAFALIEIGDVDRLAAAGGGPVFTPGEEAYARSKVDPERRLAARLAAKRAAAQVLGNDVALREIEVVRGRYGPPRLLVSGVARERMVALGAAAALVSLTHERHHAAAVVVFLP
jgi:holo-[acyl-carrier protein] synthase